MKKQAVVLTAAVLLAGFLTQMVSAAVVSVSTTSYTTISGGDSSRKNLHVQNLGPNNVYVSPTPSSATVNAGFLLKSSDTVTFEGFAGSLYGIASGSAASDVRTFKVAR